MSFRLIGCCLSPPCLDGGDGEGEGIVAEGEGCLDGAEDDAGGEGFAAEGDFVHGFEVGEGGCEGALDLDGEEGTSPLDEEVDFSAVGIPVEVDDGGIAGVVETAEELAEDPGFQDVAVELSVFTELLWGFDAGEPAAEPSVHEVQHGCLGEALGCGGAVGAQEGDDAAGLQDAHPFLGGGHGDAGAARQIAIDELLAGEVGHGVHHVLEGALVGHLCECADIALDVCLEVGAEEEVAGHAGGAEQAGVPAVPDARVEFRHGADGGVLHDGEGLVGHVRRDLGAAPRELALGEGAKLQHGNASGEALGHALHEPEALRPAHVVHARAARGVHARLDGAHQLRRVLDFINAGGATQRFQEHGGVGRGGGGRGVVVERDVVHALGQEPLQQGGLAHLPRAREQHARECLSRALHQRQHAALQQFTLSHAGIIRRHPAPRQAYFLQF